MIELDERERAIDVRARSAAAGLQRTLALRQIAPRPTHATPKGMRLVAAGFALLAVVVGLYVIATRDANHSATDPDGNVIWTIGDLPPAWHIDSVQMPQTATAAANGTDFGVYATDAAPDGPVIVLDRSTTMRRQPVDVRGTTRDLVEATVGGRRLVLATDQYDRRFAWVEVDDRWIEFSGSGVSDESMRLIAQSIETGDDGVPAIRSEQVPDGMTLQAQGPYAAVAPTLWAGLILQGSVAPTITVEYVDAATGQRAALTQTRGAGADLAMMTLLTTSRQPVTVDGDRAWLAQIDGMDVRTVIWKRDETVFALSSGTLADQELVSLAASLRPARSDEIEGAGTEVDGPTPANTELPSGTEVAGTEPAQPGDVSSDTVPEATTPPGFTTVDADPQLVRADVSTNEVTISTRVSAERAQTLHFLSVAGGVKVTADVDHAVQSSFTAYQFPSPADQQVNVFGFDNQSAVMVVTDDPDAASLEVISSRGERYVLDLTSASAHPDIRFIGMVLPTSELISASLLDHDGKVIGVPAG